MQAVFGRIFQLIVACLALLVGTARSQVMLERIEHLRYMVIELRARDCGSCCQLRVLSNSILPILQNLRTDGPKIVREAIKLSFALCHVALSPCLEGVILANPRMQRPDKIDDGF